MYPSRAEIDLGAIRNNVRLVRAHTGVQVMAVVKANGYGHGAVPVARAALEAGATWCGIATVDEAIELRRAGVDCPALLLGFVPSERVEAAIANHVSMAAWDIEHIRAASSAAGRTGETARLHILVDTGMSRLGVQPQDALQLARRLSDAPGVLLEGVWTHFARADERDPTPTDAQERSFREVLQSLDAGGIRPPLVHAANSAASLTRPSAHFDLVRLGIALYGLHPSPECPLLPGFRPALAWKTLLSQVKWLPPGRGVSYGHAYTTRTRERIGTVPVGYNDGFRRVEGNQALVGGRRVPVLGRVTMDQIMVQLDAVPEAKVHDEVVLIGVQGEASITAEDVAQRWGTINYEVTCAIGTRVPRLHLNG
jgi:alanine racemase